MTRNIKAVSILALLCLAPVAGQAYDQEVYRSAAIGTRWLSIPASARVASLAGAYTARGGEPGALESNPAALAGTHNLQAIFTHNSWIQGMQVERLVGAWEVENLGSFAVGVDYLSLGEVERIEISSSGVPVSTGSLHPNAMAFAGSWGKIYGTLALGATLRGISENQISGSDTGFEADLGAHRTLGKNWRVGAALKNLTVDFSGALRPIDLRAGGGYTFHGKHPLALDLNLDYQPQDREPPDWRIGAEWAATKQVILRGGYVLAGNDRAPGGPTVGLGWLNGFLELDYALYGAGELGFSHLVTLRILSLGE